MKKQSGIFRIVIAFFVFISLSCSQSPKVKDTFTVKKGTNISHWLSQSSKRGAARAEFFTAKDVEFIASLGFDHIRIPIDEEQMWDENGNREAEAFTLLNSALDWCAQNNLKAIVDLHILRSHHFNEAEKPLWTQPEAQQKFIDFWRDMSLDLNARPVSMVAYELMNEPVADDPEDWNKLVAKAITAVRETEPDRILVIGSNKWQSVDTFDQLTLPENDKNILLSFHMYSPLVFTHYKASWTKVGEYQGPINYPGIIVDDKELTNLPADLVNAMKPHIGEFNRETFVQLIQKPLAVSQKYGLPLYCGEWGCLPTVPAEARMQWYKDLRSVLEENNIGWATWDYKGSFGIKSNDGMENYQDLIDVLTK